MALGVNAQATNDNATAVGAQSVASGLGATVVGGSAQASGLAAVAVGFGADASADGSVAIGWNSIADSPNTVSFGGNGVYRELVNLASPTTSHSAVTLGYLQSNYTTSAVTNDALANLSSQIDAINKQMSKLGAASGTATTAAAAAAEQSAGSTATTAVATTGTPANGAASAASVASASGQSGHVAQSADSPVPGGTASDGKPADSQAQQAVASSNQYTDQQTREALQSANTYAEAQSTETLSSAKAYTDQALANYVTTDSFDQYQQQVNARFHDQDKRIDRISAMSTAMVQMAASAAGIDTPNRVGLGVGNSGGESALSVGYQRALGKKATITIGGSVSGSESSVGAGVGFGW
jgi:hypothetical protein